jgi:DNA-binding transcriptional MerR regulator
MQRELRRKLAQNYDNLVDFRKRSKVPISMETIRRLIYENQPIMAINFVVIAKRLGYSAAEIKEILTNHPTRYVKDNAEEQVILKDLLELMGDSKTVISEQEKAILSIFKKVDHLRDLTNLITDVLFLTAKGAGIDIADEVDVLKRKEKQSRDFYKT